MIGKIPSLPTASVFAGLISAFAMTAYSAEQSTNLVSVSSAETVFPDSATISLTIDVAGGTTLGAVTLEVDYDPAVIALAACLTNPQSNPDLSLVLCQRAHVWRHIDQRDCGQRRDGLHRGCRFCVRFGFCRQQCC